MNNYTEEQKAAIAELRAALKENRKQASDIDLERRRIMAELDKAHPTWDCREASLLG